MLFVEGIAEALVIPELAKTIIEIHKSSFTSVKKPETLEDFGVSIININGIYFDYFMQLFSGYTNEPKDWINKADKINIVCAGVTDNDPEVDSMPTKDKLEAGKNRCLYLIDELIGNSTNCRLFSNLKTFEYDLAMEGTNLTVMIDVLLANIKTDGDIKGKATEYSKTDWNTKMDVEKADAAKWLLDRLGYSNPMGKGEFAQQLALKLSKKEVILAVPAYIEEAIKWILGISVKTKK